MGISDLLTNDQYFDIKLLPAISRLKGKKFKIKPVEAYIGSGGESALMSVEWLLYSDVPRVSPYVGLDPTNLRASCADNPDQMAQFLQTCAAGKLHISCWQYLIGPVTQVEFRMGKRPTYDALLHRTGGVKPKTATEKIMEGVDNSIAIDNDYKRIARKRSFDAKAAEALFAERPHLLKIKEGS